MTEVQNPKQYDLEIRTLEFARKIRVFVKKLPKTIGNLEDGKQLTRSSGSIGANYIEANESLSRKEAKETRYWLYLIEVSPGDEQGKNRLIAEATEYMKIFGSIVEKSK